MARPQREKAIGVFDSGMGGLTVLRAIRERLPGEHTVYLGDTARVPYGTKSPDVVRRYALNNAAFLMRQEIKALVVACNTASAHALDALRAELPVPTLGVIEPGALAASRATRTGAIGVIGTPGTIASGAYQSALLRARPGAEVLARACPLFVPLVEEGWVEGEVVERVAERYLSDFARSGIDTLVLGCTHYPLLKGSIAKVMGGGVTLVDSAQTSAEALERLLDERQLQRNPAGGKAIQRYFVTDLPASFAEVGARFLGEAIDHLELVDL